MASLQSLAARGFRFQAVFPVQDLPTWVTRPIETAGIDLRRFQRLIMLGQGGGALWDAIRREGFSSTDLFDDYSVAAVRDLVASLGDPAYEVIYPSEVLLPLGRMAQMAGWGKPSPLGLTINDRYGLWLAHRVVFLIDADLPVTEPLDSAHPCTTCSDTPCVTACPVGAVDTVSGFDVDACSSFRVRDDSPCADRCLARLACPIGPEHAYSEEQLRYHYLAGLASIKRWYRA